MGSIETLFLTCPDLRGATECLGSDFSAIQFSRWRSRSREAISSIKDEEAILLCHEAIFSGRENSRKPRFVPITHHQTIKLQRGSIMWSIITTLIYYYIIVPGWKLTRSDAAKIRGRSGVR